MVRFVSDGLQADYGIAMSARPRARIALLPLPRLGFDDVRLTAGGRDGPTLAEGGRLTLQLNLSALLLGRVEIATVALDHAAIQLPAGDDHRWNATIARMVAQGAGAVHPRRVTVSGSTVTGRDPRDGSAQRASAVDLAVSWPFWSAGLAVTGGFTWNGTPARFSLTGLVPRDVIEGRASPVAAIATWPAGSLSLDGAFGRPEASPARASALTMTGQGSFRTQSLSGTLAWIGGDVALSPMVEDLVIEGRFEVTREGIALPSVHVETGGNRLDGAGSAAFGAHRTAVQATLAADDLNLSPLVGTLMRVAGLDGSSDAQEGWARRSLALGPLTGGDLDLRLSAGTARLGPIVLDDLATSVIVRADGVEAALGRAGFQGGTLKGRLVLAAAKPSTGAGPATEVRAQGAFENVDLGAVLIDVGQSRWLLGATQGTLNLEGTGRDVADLMRRVGGRVSLGIDGGSFAGFDLADVIHRGGVLATGSLARRNSRTPFERAGVSVLFADGIGEITEGALAARALTANLRGRVSLPDRSFQARAELLSRAASSPEATVRPATLFEIGGPWDSVAVRRLGPGEAPSRGEGPPVPTLAAPVLPERARAYAP